MTVRRFLKFGLIKGYFENLPDIISQAMNVDYEIVYKNDASMRLPNGSWTGLIGMVNRSEIDLAVADFFVTKNRSEGAIFSFPLFVGDFTFATPKAEYFPDTFAIFNLVSSALWLTLGIFALIMAIVFYLFFKNRSFSDISFIIISTPLRQVLPLKPRTAGQYLLMLFWIVGMAFFSTCCQSILLSFLALPPLSKVRDVSELAVAVKRGEYRCMTMESSIVPYLLINSKKQGARIIGENILKSPMAEINIEEFLRLSNKRVAYLESAHNLNHLRDRYFISKDSLFPSFLALAARKDFCCKELLDMTILKITESGIYQKLKRNSDFLTTLSIKSHYSNEMQWPRNLSLSDVKSAFMILIIGNSVSLVVLAIEIIVCK